MLTMTVMQNEREALGQFSTEPTEAKDVLSQLRHLHHTLQECRWRVQVVDNALCAQGDKGHYGLQNQTEYHHSFEIEATKDCSFQNQSKDSNAQNKAEEDQHFEKETIDCKKDLKNYGLQSHSSEDQNCQSGNNEDYENLIDENLKCQKSAEENDSFIGTTSKDLKLSVHAEDGNIQDNKKNTDSNTNVSNLSSIALSECSLCDDIEKDIHDETEKETYINNSFKKCWNGETHSSETIHSKYFTRQECINTVMKEEDRLPLHTNEYLSSTMPPLYDFLDPTSSQSNTMTDLNYQQGQLENADVTFPRKQREKKEEQKDFYGNQELENKFCCKGDLTLNKNPKKEDASPEQYEKNEKVQSVENIGAAHIDPVPEVAQKINVIWEALENLRTHFFALHSSLVNTADIFHRHESLDKSHINSEESDNVHSILEDHISEATLFHRIPCERSLLGTFPFRNHHHCLCQNQISSHPPHEEPVNSAALSGKETRRTYLRYWQDNCLCMVMAVLLLLLFLFLASCLLLMLPVVSVSVRTAGGLPAF
ncbi:uncharacterized protein LOC123520594 [Portunus trituberculatus]|uniref:Uncharacterized protein n=1 Tax=Portunus trituberculatus TaxID=210409 RepID=A0A5B7HP87_PORTR|nr:uncharacterized protein LOC123520594 [Portunus trituberculatus]XP_045138947.1 uncharacterized protein LOC123520594 [Portunus trituberculatus]XP_045138948.1 uncharacterized protein LOC123520594 [Portunus trituberculatus]XP_045138949.1 uncharacterized protein LOC123520594 [Portunus trituberculatus]XP_045138950.1 uncharacterized protein LOC123520594 [Portunus trituberculatus]XP_045138951.1 uncharacterized protein LOC123520594 [Portunus trituberculatus]XP_045138952.1 uncharacterized protein LO